MKIRNLSEVKKMRKLLSNRSPFALAAVTAIVIGVGDLIATGTDILWLVGDMSRDAHGYHYPVFVGLALAFFVMVASYYWLIKSVITYLKRHEKMHGKKCDDCKLYSPPVLGPTHCGKKDKKVTHVNPYGNEFFD